MIRKIAWETFKNTGNINSFMEFKQIENIEKEIKSGNVAVVPVPNPTHNPTNAAVVPVPNPIPTLPHSEKCGCGACPQSGPQSGIPACPKPDKIKLKRGT